LENRKNEVMDLEKYKNDGWGLSKKEMSELLSLIINHKKDTLKVVEFGSGNSTRFLVDVVLEGIKKLDIVSFDDNPKFAYQNTDNHKFIDLKIRSLVECSDDEYNQMFVTRKYDTKVMLDKTSPLTTRQKNNFYKIENGDLDGIFDIMILDGPNGNGRNISYLHMFNHLDVGSIVLIDDASQYEFVPYFEKFFEHEVLFSCNTGMLNQWDNGGDYIITRVTKRK
jgi:hypothetical protein